jgi:hypothetical protein
MWIVVVLSVEVEGCPSHRMNLFSSTTIPQPCLTLLVSWLLQVDSGQTKKSALDLTSAQLTNVFGDGFAKQVCLACCYVKEIQQPSRTMCAIFLKNTKCGRWIFENILCQFAFSMFFCEFLEFQNSIEYFIGVGCVSCCCGVGVVCEL